VFRAAVESYAGRPTDVETLQADYQIPEPSPRGDARQIRGARPQILGQYRVGKNALG